MRKFYSFFGMKIATLLIAIVSFLHTSAQFIVVSADPALGSCDITNLAGVSVNANELNAGSSYLLKLTVYNLSPSLEANNIIPPNSALVNIVLGAGMRLDPTYNLNTAPFNNYFTFQYVLAPARIFCNINTNIPRDFNAEFSFRVIAGPQVSSKVIANFQIPNNNPDYVLTDLNSGNNGAGIDYTVGPAAGPLPVNITNLTARNRECIVDVNWKVSQEINVATYDVEVSKDGASFVKAATVYAASKSSYNANIPLTEQLKSPLLFIRLKSVDNDGTFKYSSIVTVKGNCLSTPNQVISCYPNPVTNESYITLAAKGENFNGIYLVSLLDAAGKSYFLRKVTLLNVPTFKLDLINHISAGNYFIKLQRESDKTISTLRFIKK